VPSTSDSQTAEASRAPVAILVPVVAFVAPWAAAFSVFFFFFAIFFLNRLSFIVVGVVVTRVVAVHGGDVVQHDLCSCVLGVAMGVIHSVVVCGSTSTLLVLFLSGTATLLIIKFVVVVIIAIVVIPTIVRGRVRLVLAIVVIPTIVRGRVRLVLGHGCKWHQ
jgi:hypothetical protein